MGVTAIAAFSRMVLSGHQKATQKPAPTHVLSSKATVTATGEISVGRKIFIILLVGPLLFTIAYMLLRGICNDRPLITPLYRKIRNFVRKLFGMGPKDPPSGGGKSDDLSWIKGEKARLKELGKLGWLKDSVVDSRLKGLRKKQDRLEGLGRVKKSSMVGLVDVVSRATVHSHFRSVVSGRAMARLARQVGRMTPRKRQAISARQLAIGAAVVGSALLLRGLVRNPVAQKGLQRASALVR